MTDFVDVPAGTEQARAGLNFTRINSHGGIPTASDRLLRLQVDGRYIADVWEAVPGSWSTSGVAGHLTGFGSAAEAEDAVIAAYRELPVLADYEIDVLIDEQWRTVLVGRVGVDADRLSALGVKAQEIAVEYQSLRNLPVRVTLWSTTAPTSRVTTYAEYHLEEPMSELPGQGQGQTDPLTADPATPAAGPVNVDWSTLGQSDRVWRVNPATGQPQGLTIERVNADTVTGQLDDGPTVTLPQGDIAAAGDPPAPMLILEDEVARLFGASNSAPGKSDWMQRMLLAVASDPDTLVWVHDPKAGGATRAWMSPWAARTEKSARRALADPDEMVIGWHLDGSAQTWRPVAGGLVPHLPPLPRLDPDSQAIADQYRGRSADPLTWVYVPERKWMSPKSEGAAYDHVMEIDADGAWSSLSHGSETTCEPSRAWCTVAEVMDQAAGLGLPVGRYLVGVNDVGDRLLIGDRIG